MTFVEFISALNSCKQQSIVWHNQTTSYAEHKALNKFYDAVVDQLDALVESVSGVYGRPKGYDVHDLEDWTSTEDTLKYFQAVLTMIKTERKSIYQDSFIQNQIDELEALVATTIYLLTLK